MRFTRWDQKESTDVTNDILKRLASVHCSRISESYTREYFIASLTSNNILDLCNYSPAYDSLSIWDAIQVRQVCAFFNKRADLDLGIDRRRAAVDSFIAAESLCRQTNILLDKRREGEFSFPPYVEAVLMTAQRKIASILGDVPVLSDLKIRFGPGATTQVQKRMASPRRKLSQTLACSEDFLPVVRQSLEELEGWLFAECKDASSQVLSVEIHPCKLSFIPKSYKTFRSVCSEPALNGMFQAGIGSHISERLRRAGVDISDQTRNQRLAREGSLTGALATLDLSSASDTISTELVYELLPYDWAVFLDRYRTKSVNVEGYVFKQEKFSSMGNGFTFPLETLIFYGLAYACTVGDELQNKVSVYGDDIIVPVSCYALLTDILHRCGFIPNLSKSFSTGRFRESCGADYLSGIDIRPSYIKDALSAFDVFRLHNFYVRAGDTECAAILLEYLDPSLQKWGPDGYGDGHLIGDAPLAPFKRERGWCGFVFETYTFKPKKDFTVLPGDRVYPLYSTYASSLPLVSEGEDLAGYAREFVAGLPAHSYDSRDRLGVSIPGRNGDRKSVV